MTIRKRAGILLAALLLAGTCLTAALPIRSDAYASAAQPAAGSFSDGETQGEAVLSAENAALFLPESYEQYLELNAPRDVAVSQNYIAVADGTTLYLYKRGEKSAYRSYTANDIIPKIQFAGERLYFTVRGTSNSFWYYDCALGEATRVDNLNCSTFLIVENTLYTAVIGGEMTLARRSLDRLEEKGEHLGTLKTGTEPWLAWADNTLYCVVDGIIYCPDEEGHFNEATGYYISDYQQSSGISSVCSDGAYLYFSSPAGFFRRGTAPEDEPVLLSSARELCGVTALTRQDGTFWCVSGTSVHEIAVSESAAAFTDYEIAAASDSPNRISQAADTVRAGELLVIADSGNNRVNVYHFGTGEFTALPCEGSPSHVATDGSLIACSVGEQVYLCDFAAGERSFTSAQLAGTDVAGLCVLYGKTYYVKGNGTRGVVDGASVETQTRPTGLAADLYGNLYVSYSEGTAKRFTEEDFLTAGHAGEDTAVAVPANALSLRADFEGNLYYLSDGTLYRNGERFASFSGSFVYAQGAQEPLSFALGFEDDAVYFNFGNYLVVNDVSTQEAEGPLAGIPTLNEIEEDGARETVFSFHAAEGILCDVAAGSVGISTDLAAFRAETGAYFPYRGYARTQDVLRGILLASTSEEAGGYSLLLFAEQDGSYTARLYRSSCVIPAEQTWREEEAQRWITNAVGASYAPCMETALSALTLERGTQVTLLGHFTAPDRDYALIEYVDGTRGTQRGWVPSVYLSALSPVPAEGESYTIGYLKANKEGTLFTAADGSEQLVTERVQVRLYDNGDGTYTARLAEDTSFAAVVSAGMIDKDNAEALRIALIVILSVLALVILGTYLFLLPWEKYKKKK